MLSIAVILAVIKSIDFVPLARGAVEIRSGLNPNRWFAAWIVGDVRACG